MAVDGHLNFDTKIDEKGFSGGVKKLGSIASGGLKVVGGAVAGVTTVMGAGLAAGMKYNSSMENYFANFETMLGSADLATQHVNQLKEFAAKTPFEMSDLANASQTLLSFGNDADKVMPVMKQLGDISLGNKDKFNSLALVYGQVSSQGKLMGQDLLQCINAGFNPLLTISEHTGESMESLKDKMSKGQIGIEEMDQALKWATEDGGRFAGGMEKASQTMSGLISTLKDNAMSLVGEVVQPISDSMTETLLPAAIDAVDELTTAFREGGVEGLIEAGGSILSNLLLGIAEQLPMVLETAISFVNTFAMALTEQLPRFIEAGGGILSALAQGIANLIPTLLTLGVNLIVQLASAIASAAPTMIPKGINTVMLLINGILQKIPDVIKAGADLIVAIVNGLVEALPQLIAYLPTIINTILDVLINALPVILQAGVEILIALINGIIASIPQLIAAIPQVIMGFVNAIINNLDQIIESGIRIIAALIAGLIRAIPDIVGAIPTIVSSIIRAFVNVNWGDVGRNIIRGIANGILGGVGSIITAAKNAAKAALNAAKNFLGIHSPSRVFRDQVGKYMAEGLGVGFEDNIPEDDIGHDVGRLVRTAQEAAVPTSGSASSDNIRYANVRDGDADSGDERNVSITIVNEIDGAVLSKKTVQYTDNELGRRKALKEKGVI